jgi:hypothetical protein
MFFDFKKNPEHLEVIVKSTEYDQSVKMKLSSLAELVRSNDRFTTDSVELVIGDAPQTPL